VHNPLAVNLSQSLHRTAAPGNTPSL